MRITADSHLEPLLAPLPANEQGEEIGVELEDSADYLRLEAEMMKVGSLQHQDVDWDTAEALAITMLSHKGKDLKVLGHLLHCLQHEGNGVRFALSLRLLTGCLEAWWALAYPFNGARGAKLRPRLFQQFTQRTLKLAAGLDFHNAEDEFLACRHSLEKLQTLVADKQLPADSLDELMRLLNEKQPNQNSAASDSQGGNASGGDARRSAASSSNEAEKADQPGGAKVPELRLEAGNERANRQSLLKMADFLGEQNPGEPLAYRLRRYAIWSAIQALPAAREGGRTELAPVAADRVADYREALSRGGDEALWQRIEKSVAVSPYWLEGHRLSAELAKRLGLPRCADAIRDESARFVERLPGIESLTFNDGSPFLDNETQQWLYSGTGSGANDGTGGGEAWHAGLEEARTYMGSEGLGPALQVLDQGLASARSLRESTYWRLASADLLKEAGLETLAQQHYSTLHQTVNELDLEQWEPALVSRLQASLRT
ncbi:type VI secretion system protein TssA [Vreelandella boliviensis]|uniref:type VI secretion system protein TssA n=1 Tax=Vreelandella boliviensis TaxID=223527 RepID=UPI001B8C4BBD|nr:type VI secretion system protein TssA [Halomonas boliviensis]MBS3667278.1 type VI secretion system protein TssA [Halomonas boliviensis]